MKKILISFALVIAYTLQVSAQIPTNPIMDFTFKNGALKNNANTIGNLSVVANQGYPSPTTDRDGNPNALQLKGGMRLGGVTTSSTKTATISYWIKHEPNSTLGKVRLIDMFSNSGLGNTGIGMHIEFTAAGTKLHWNGGAQSNGSFRTRASDALKTGLDDNEWHHIVLRAYPLSVTDSIQVDVFVDGAKIANLSDKAIITPSANWYFIREAPIHIAGDSKYDGAIDDLRLYYKKITDAEVTALYNETSQGGKTTYVNANATGANNGTSWADAYTDARNAFINATYGENVWIAKGKYIRTAVDRISSFGWTKDGVAAYGGFIGTETSLDQRDWRANPTIFSGDLGNDGDASNNAYTVFLGPSGQTSSTSITASLIDGIIIQDGNGNAASGTYQRQGGGTYIDAYSTGIVFQNCTWRDNTAVIGAGLYVSGEYGAKNIQVLNCKFLRNKSRANAPFGFYTRGGNIEATIKNSLIADNELIKMNGNNAIDGCGGSFYSYNGGTMNAIVANNTWANNKIIDPDAAESITLVYVRRFGNGNGLLFMNNCIFNQNDGTDKTIGFRSIANNSSGSMKKIIHNCLFSDSTTIDMASTDIKHGWLEGDAKFTSVAASDYHLTSSSPALNAGSNPNAGELSAKDLDGNDRVQGSAINLGCYEGTKNGAGIKSATNTFRITTYPNPTSGLLNIRTNKAISQVSVINVNGKQVMQPTANNKTIDVSSLPIGVYFLIITTEGNTIGHSKFIKL